MSDLIETLKDQHNALSDSLGRVRKMGITSPEGRELLFQIKTGLLEHLKLEDEELYPALTKGAKNDEMIKTVLVTFQENMVKISKAALGFFDKYHKDSRNPEFTQDIAMIISTISDRIKKEELILFPSYEYLLDGETKNN